VITVLLIGSSLIAVRCLYLLRYPLGPCRRCRGTGTNKGSNRKRWGMCKACGGAKQRQRFGAGAVHRFWWSVRGATLHERRKERVEEAREKGGYPEL
jgi:hypothetical protein